MVALSRVPAVGGFVMSEFERLVMQTPVKFSNEQVIEKPSLYTDNFLALRGLGFRSV